MYKSPLKCLCIMTLFSSPSTNVARSSKLDKNILFCCSYEYLTHFTCSVVRELVSRLITCCSGKLLTTDRLVNTRATVTRHCGHQACHCHYTQLSQLGHHHLLSPRIIVCCQVLRTFSGITMMRIFQ